MAMEPIVLPRSLTVFPAASRLPKTNRLSATAVILTVPPRISASPIEMLVSKRSMLAKATIGPPVIRALSSTAAIVTVPLVFPAAVERASIMVPPPISMCLARIEIFLALSVDEAVLIV